MKGVARGISPCSIKMQFKNFTINIKHDSEIEDLNSFLNQNKIITITKNLVNIENNYYWNFLVEYIEKETKHNKDYKYINKKNEKIDYKEILSPQDFIIFSKLREIRKEIAEKEGIPVYTVFTNEQLAKIVTEKILSKSKLSEINGIGEQKINNYSEKILEFMKSIPKNSVVAEQRSATTHNNKE